MLTTASQRQTLFSDEQTKPHTEQRKQILLFEKLKPANVRRFCLINELISNHNHCWFIFRGQHYSHHRSSTSEGGEDACDEQSKRSIWGWQTDWGNVWLTDHSQGRLFSKVIKDLWPHFPALHLNCRSMAKKRGMFMSTQPPALILNQRRVWGGVKLLTIEADD